MDRLLVIKLDVLDCDAEALLNGVPIARADPARPRVVRPVHEYTVAGANRIELVVWPRPAQPGAAEVPPAPRVGDGRRWAQLRVMLPRVGQPVDEASARTLAQVDWAPAVGEAYEAPVVIGQPVELPVAFPRWRWLDAPAGGAGAGLQASVHAFVTEVAAELAQGSPDRLIAAARLRTEELAVAYQRRADAETLRLREHLLALHEQRRLNWAPLAATELQLRPLAGGRLFECLDAAGLPALRTEAAPGAPALALPLRVSSVEGRVYVLR